MQRFINWIWRERSEANWYIAMLEIFLFTSFINDIIGWWSN